MDLLAAAKRQSIAALARVTFFEATAKAAKNAGYSSLQAALADLSAVTTLPDKKAGARAMPRVKDEHKRPETVTKVQLTAALKAGLTGRQIAAKFGRTLSWLNKRKAQWKLSSKR